MSMMKEYVWQWKDLLVGKKEEDKKNDLKRKK